MKPSENLIAARDYLIEHGWTQGGLFDRRGRVCALGALHRIGQLNLDTLETDYLAQAIKEADGWLRAPYACSFNIVSAFNDTHTESEVVAIYDRAIIIAKEAEA